MKNTKRHCRLKKMHRLAPGCKYDYHLNASLDLHKRSVVLKMNIKSATQSAKSVCRTRLLAYWRTLILPWFCMRYVKIHICNISNALYAATM